MTYSLSRTIGRVIIAFELIVIKVFICERWRGGGEDLIIFLFFFLLLSLQLFKALALQPNSSIEIERSK